MIDFLKQVLGGNGVNVAAAFMAGLNENSGPVREVLDEVSAWASALAKNAVLKWAPRLVFGRHCEQGTCEGPGFVLCDSCGKAACLSHSRIDYAGEGTCAACIEELLRAKQAGWAWPERPRRPKQVRRPTPPKDAVAESFRVLGLQAGASWDEVKSQYKKLVFKMSPDREQDEAARAKKTEKMKRINAAFQVLEEHYRRAA
jgi:hypothetical protein